MAWCKGAYLLSHTSTHLGENLAKCIIHAGSEGRQTDVLNGTVQIARRNGRKARRQEVLRLWRGSALVVAQERPMPSHHIAMTPIASALTMHLTK